MPTKFSLSHQKTKQHKIIILVYIRLKNTKSNEKNYLELNQGLFQMPPAHLVGLANPTDGEEVFKKYI